MITRAALTQAEGAYSRQRFRALADEWYGLYPNLLHIARLLRNREHFTIRELPPDEVQDNILQLYVSGNAKNGLDFDLMNAVWDSSLSIDEYIKELVLILHRVGLVGLKIEAYSLVSWAFSGGMSISSAELHGDTKVFVHPAFWRVLGIRNE